MQEEAPLSRDLQSSLGGEGEALGGGLTCTQPRPDARPPGGGAASKGESEKTTARPRAGPSLLRVPLPGGFPAQEGAGVFHRLSSGRRLKITREGVGDLLQRPRF